MHVILSREAAKNLWACLRQAGYARTACPCCGRAKDSSRPPGAQSDISGNRYWTRVYRFRGLQRSAGGHSGVTFWSVTPDYDMNRQRTVGLCLLVLLQHDDERWLALQRLGWNNEGWPKGFSSILEKDRAYLPARRSTRLVSLCQEPPPERHQRVVVSRPRIGTPRALATSAARSRSAGGAVWTAHWKSWACS